MTEDEIKIKIKQAAKELRLAEIEADLGDKLCNKIHRVYYQLVKSKNLKKDKLEELERQLLDSLK